MTPIALKEPPNNIAAECMVIGGLLVDHENAKSYLTSLAECMSIIPDPCAFWEPVHRTLYSAIMDLAGENLPVSIQSVLTRCRLDPVEEHDTRRMAANRYEYNHVLAPAYAREVRECYRRRLLGAAGENLSFRMHDDEWTADDLASTASTSIAEAVSAGGTTKSTTYRQAAEMVRAGLMSGRPLVVPTGVRTFDSTFGGFPRGSLVTVLGTPSSGKTTFCLQTLFHAAKSGESVLVYSNEQNATRIACTLLSMDTGIQIHERLNNQTVTKDELAAIEMVIDGTGHLKIEIIDESMNAGQIFAHAQIAKNRGATIAMIDYLQDLPPMPGCEQGEARVGESMRCLKRLARELEITTIIVSQQDKASSKTQARPTMYDGMYSARIEQASDMMIGVWREFLNVPYPTIGPNESEIAFENRADTWKENWRRTEAIVLKNKYGARGASVLRFDPSRMFFEEA